MTGWISGTPHQLPPHEYMQGESNTEKQMSRWCRRQTAQRDEQAVEARRDADSLARF